MCNDSIRELLGREPFQPFRVRASSGVAYEVRSPGLVVLLKSQVLMAEPNRIAIRSFRSCTWPASK